jgi:RNA polymerase sigma-70 factor (ECF subfamily)
VADANLLFSAHRDGVFRYLSRLVGQAEAARDLTQDVFLRVVRGPVPQATDVEHRAWVFAIARNLALNHLRDRRRRPNTVELTDTARPATQELAAALQQALDALPAVERDVFLLRESAGLSYGEIATACELTVDAVRMRLHRARTGLRAALAGPMADQWARGVRIAQRDGRGSHD